jgi:hypothetical protein
MNDLHQCTAAGTSFKFYYSTFMLIIKYAYTRSNFWYIRELIHDNRLLLKWKTLATSLLDTAAHFHKDYSIVLNNTLPAITFHALKFINMTLNEYIWTFFKFVLSAFLISIHWCLVSLLNANCYTIRSLNICMLNFKSIHHQWLHDHCRCNTFC